MATINGTTGNDNLAGTTGADTINGLGGNDSLLGADGNDSVVGGAGNDTVRGNNGTDWVEGGAGNDNVGGGSGQDSFVFREAGTANADVFNDFASDWDNIQLDAAFFSALGSAGQFTAGDVRFWSSTAGTAHDADDRIIYNSTTRQLWYDADGNGSGAAQLIGTLNSSATVVASDIRVFGTAPGGGNQTINGTSGNDSLVGGPGNDTINGLAGNDTLIGNAGDDSLVGGDGDDSLLGGDGNDSLAGGNGNNTLDGGLGDDTYLGFSSIVDAGGTDTLIAGIGGLPDGIENFIVRPDFGDIDVGGNALDNRITVEKTDQSGIVFVEGGAGNDTITSDEVKIFVYNAGVGNDSVEGGTSSVLAFSTAVELNFALGTATTSEGSVTFSGIGWGIGSDFADEITARDTGNTVLGGSGNDTIIGGAGNDSLLGEGGWDHPSSGTGNDSIFGGAGNDFIRGNAGGDTMDGGAGNDTLSAFKDEAPGENDGSDTFLFSVAPGTANADVIQAFRSGDDRIVLDGNAHASSGPSGDFAPEDGRFFASSAGIARDGGDRVLYSTATGELWYDADGSGAGARQLIATLEGAPNLVATDIQIVNGSGGSTINGTSGNDSLSGTAGNDTINGLAGNDTLSGLDGDDLLDGGADADTILGGSGNDELRGDFGNDSIVGGDGNDMLDGAPSSSVSSWSGSDTLDGGLGDDTYNVEDTGDVLRDAGGNDTVLTNISWTLGAGFENLFFTNLFFDDNGIPGLEGHGNELANVMKASFGDDALLDGRAGNDTLLGGGGVDELIGGAGNDVLSGGGSELDSSGDTFVFNVAPGTANADQITDFRPERGTIVLDGAVHVSSGPSGSFAAGDARFWSSTTGTAHDADDRVIYNTSNGELWYDADGNGAGARQLIATLDGAPALAAANITIVNGSASGSTINGTAGNDTLNGTAGDDTINGLGGNDLLRGNEGADLLRGGDGNDTLISGEATGISFASDSAPDTLDGGLGDDVYHVVESDGDVIITDPGGIDTVVAWSSWTLGAGLENLTLGDDAGVGADGTGNELDNHITSATEGGTLRGMGGNDTLLVRNAENFIDAHGGDGNDTLLGGHNQDNLFGDAGDDLLESNAGGGNLTGGTGADTFFFNTPPDPANPGIPVERITDFTSTVDTIRLDADWMEALGASGRFSAGDARFIANTTGTAQDASDRVIYNGSTGELFYDGDGSGAGEAGLIVTLQGAPSLAATDIEVVNGTAPGGSTINGTANADTLTGTAGNDTINGLGGNDTIDGSAGVDVIDGGAGTDIIQYRTATSGIVANFATGSITGGFPGASVSFSNVEKVLGSNFNDQLTGNAAAQNLTGQAGNDTITGGAGVDTLWGGTGNDVFLFNGMGTANADRISDWASGQDKIHLTDEAFSAIGATGSFAAGDARFWSSTAGTAHDANDRVIYNTSTGELYYDADGTGSGAAQIVATVLNHPAVAATDIVVV